MHVLETQNLAFCDKKEWKNVCLKRVENMHLASLWKETITVRPIQLSDCSHYVPAFSPPSTMQKVVQRKKNEIHESCTSLKNKKSDVFQRVSFKRFFFSED